MQYNNNINKTNNDNNNNFLTLNKLTICARKEKKEKLESNKSKIIKRETHQN